MEQKLVSMVQYILDIDWMLTSDFCDAYKIPHPYFTGDIKTSADKFLQVDAIKHKMHVEYAKLLNKDITSELLLKMGFESLNVKHYHPRFKNKKYEITNDEFGFRLEPYDSSTGSIRLNKVVDLVGLGIYIKK